MSPCVRPIRCHLPSCKISLPAAHAASSITGSPCRRASGRIAARSHRIPIWCGQRIARVRGEQCEMQRRGAARHRARLRRTHGGGEFIFKGRSLRPHREPAREDHAPCGGGSGLAGFGQAERDVWG